MSSLESLMLDHSQHMSLLVEPGDLRILVANRAVETTLGYAREELLQRPITDIESSLQDVFYWEDVRNGQYQGIEAQEGLYLAADGTMLPVRKSVRVIRRDGQTLFLVEAADIRNERRIEEDLAHTTSQLRATLESTGNGILVIDWKGQVASMNRLFGRMWQLSDELLLEEDSDAILAFIADQVQEGELCRERFKAIVDGQATEDLFHLRDGRVFECKSRPQYLGEHIIGRVFGFSDITERIRIQQELMTACHRAEAANRAKTDFLAMMSHEIRTPMNGVVGMTQLMLATPLDAEQRRYLDVILSSSEALLSIINDILDFSKIEARKLVLEAIDFNLLSLLEDLSDLFGLRAAEKGIEFTCHIAPQVPMLLRGDPGRIRQILTNLIGNAIKFTHAGSIALLVAGRQESGDRVVLEVQVQDTGIGIPASRITEIFLPFEQADSSTTRKYGGTGLGLSITKELVELMGGRIQVASRENEGSTFSFTIALERQAADGAEMPVPGMERLRELRGTPVLMVDDNEVTRRSVASLLTTWGFEVEVADSASEALVRIEGARQRGRPFRCVLVDMIMPVTDGESLGRRILENPANAGTALIMCTAAGCRGDARRLEEAGFAAYLQKPLRRSILLQCLLTVLCKAGEAPASIVTRHSLAEASRHSCRLLVVEDNATNLTVIRGVLSKLGFDRVDSATDGQEAVAAASRGRYDLILMDCQMPGMDGYEVTRRLRAMGVKTAIVAMTASAMSGDREKCLEAGMDDYLTKPIVIERLAEAIDRWMTSPGSLGIDQEKAADAGAVPEEFPVFDREEFLGLLMGDQELAATVLQMFLEDAPGDIAKLRDAVASGDCRQIQMASHCLKGAAANVFAVALCRLARDLELAATGNDLARIGKLMEGLEAKWQAFLKHPKIRETARSLSLPQD